MEAMKDMPDKAYDLAIVDPPYGIGENWKKDKHSKFYKHSSSYKNNLSPDEKYFQEVFRCSKNQIIWGANYYWNFLPTSNNLIVWDKSIRPEKQFMSAGELAWTSIKRIPFNIVNIDWNGCVTIEKRHGKHPHEKPVALYKWLLKNYAKPGDKILDTHGGSMSIAIACHDMGFDLDLWELDADYYAAGVTRFEQHKKQGTLFKPSEIINYKEQKLL